MAAAAAELSLFCCFKHQPRLNPAIVTGHKRAWTYSLPGFQPLDKINKGGLRQFRVSANFGGGGGGEEEGNKTGGKKKFITREEEPEQYWQTAGEREGENPMKTPLPYIIIFGMSTPFVILAIAFANGWVKVPVR